MHEPFANFIKDGKELAEQKLLNWEFDLDPEGRASTGWNLTELVGAMPPVFHLRDFGQDDGTLTLLNEVLLADGSPPVPKSCLSQNWQDLIKATACDQLFYRRNSPGHVYNNVIRPIKVLATCAVNLEPWQLTVDVIRKAHALATTLQPSGRLADQILGVTKTIIDVHSLAECSPMFPLVAIDRMKSGTSNRSKAAKSKDQLLDDLDQRKRTERLPEKRAFWELIRIIFTERPRSYTDAIRFAALKTMVICGLRVGEAVMLPLDWRRNRDYYDPTGHPAGEFGGYSRSLMLRYFAEKQQSDYTSLFEATQAIPEMFAEILSETLDDIVRISEPLRQTLRLQVESGRILPWYERNELVPAIELYTRLTGNPFWLRMSEGDSSSFVSRYREGFNPDILNELFTVQKDRFLHPHKSSFLDPALYVFYSRVFSNEFGPKFRHSSGEEYGEGMKKWSEVYLRIGEIEDYISRNISTKIPDTKPIKLQSNELQTWELLFLIPKRSLAEERNDGITDISRYFSVGIPSGFMLIDVLGEGKSNKRSLFEVYGESVEDKKLVLRSHSLRHLQNTELFRLGVADTIITKRFNRKSVAQSYDYDHRSLSEHLDSIELPPEVEIALGSNASTVARLIKTGKATGPIVDSFKRIQLEEGDEAALEFLKVEADGFHATPYGHCINSFTVDPCPKNLECFNGCCHLTATNLPENRRHLIALESRLQSALDEVCARPMNSIGRTNQIAHATVRLDAVRKLQATPNGQIVFPDGPDLSLPHSSRSVLDVR